jgi:hypothetical protein
MENIHVLRLLVGVEMKIVTRGKRSDERDA